MACATNMVRYAFFLFNLIIWILGVVVLGVGIWSRVENDTWKDLITADTLAQASNLLIAAGIIVAMLGFLGCCGAIKKIQALLIGYAVLVFLIFVLEIAAGAYAYTKQDEVEAQLVAGVQKGIKENYGKDDKASKGLTIAIDWFQSNVKCCGANGPRDWGQDSWWYKHKNSNPHNAVPKSCCKTNAADCNLKINNATIYMEGCVSAGKNYALGNMKTVGGVGVGIAIVELFGIAFALCLCSAFRREERGDPIN